MSRIQKRGRACCAVVEARLACAEAARSQQKRPVNVRVNQQARLNELVRQLHGYQPKFSL